ncbi:MAG: hypothetical protein ACK5LO_10980 [Leucobacter sp.]
MTPSDQWSPDDPRAAAEAAKIRAEAKKIEAEADQIQASTAQKTDTSATEQKKAEEEEEEKDTGADAIKDLLDRIAKAMPDTKSFEKNSVTVTEDRILRRGEFVAEAVTDVANQIASDVWRIVSGAEPRVETSDAPPKPQVFVTSDHRIVANLVLHRQMRAELQQLAAQLEQAVDAGKRLTAPAEQPTEFDVLEAEQLEAFLAHAREITVRLRAVPGSAPLALSPLTAAAAVAPLIGDAVTAAASLLQYDTAVAADTADIPALTLQSAVIRGLTWNGIEVIHEWARVAPCVAAPQGEPSLLTDLEKLTTLDIAAAGELGVLASTISALGDPEAERTEAAKEIAQTKADSYEREAAIQRRAKAESNIERLEQLRTAQARITALVARAQAFVERITNTGDGASASPLALAHSIEPLVARGSELRVLVVGGANTQAEQILLTRRIFAPRAQVSVAAEATYLLLHDERVLTAGNAHASRSYFGRITWEGAIWKPSSVHRPHTP